MMKRSGFWSAFALAAVLSGPALAEGETADTVMATVNGTKIHVLDEQGVQKIDPNVTYKVEAEWGPEGAVCLNSANTRLSNQNIECQIPACGSTSFSSGGILQSGRITSGL